MTARVECVIDNLIAAILRILPGFPASYLGSQDIAQVAE